MPEIIVVCGSKAGALEVDNRFRQATQIIGSAWLRSMLMGPSNLAQWAL